MCFTIYLDPREQQSTDIGRITRNERARAGACQSRYSCVTDVVLAASASPPLNEVIVPFAITWMYQIQIYHYRNEVSYYVQYHHDGFPAHEFYISYKGNVEQKYCWVPPGSHWIGSAV